MSFISDSLTRSLELMKPLTDDVRHPIIQDVNDDIGAISMTLHLAALKGDAKWVRVLCEVLYVLGWQAGKADTLDPSVWNDKSKSREE